MRISDWSSDVCSSDLGNGRRPGRARDAMSMAAPFPGTMPAPGGCASAAERIHSAAMDIPGADDETLMQAYGAGNLAASDALYARHRAGLYRYILRSTRNPHQADDIFQETWSRVIDARSEEHTSELQSLMRISYAVF